MKENRDPAMEKILRLMADMQALEPDDALSRVLCGPGEVLFPQPEEALADDALALVTAAAKPPENEKIPPETK